MKARESDKILERLLSLHPKIIDLSLDRMYDLLEKLGNPQKKLPPVIHVAGTNGKGSTIAYLRAILEETGLSVHVYTSPHLVNFNERIRLAGKLITEEKLQKTLAYCEEINGGKPITYFEITTAAAIKAFADTPADVLILEVGLGGRLDATNVIDETLCSIVTPVSMDHEQFLGNTLEAIATEKAHIAKKSCPLVYAPQDDVAEQTILNIANNKNATICDNWHIIQNATGFQYTDSKNQFDLPVPNLIGPHQISNAALAIAALRHQDKFLISDDQFINGIQKANWPARMQNISKSNFGKLLSESSELWLDGGHNPAAAKVILNHFKYDNLKDNKLTLICGMMENKDTSEYLKILSPITAKLYGVHVEGEASHKAEEIVNYAKQNGISAKSVISVKEALIQIGKDTATQVLICGSLYLAGQILSDNDLIPD